MKEFTSPHHPVRRWRNFKENLIAYILFFCAASSVAITFGIGYILIQESIPFFKTVSFQEFFTATEWTPMFDNARFGIAPLLLGTLVTTLIALTVSLPLGTVIAIYLSEYANSKQREWLKPILELLAAVPTVVYGYFALLFVTPNLQKFLPELPGFSMLSAGIVMGIMILPYVSSLTEDALRAVPDTLREGAMALGSTPFQTAWKVILPAASSGVISSYILAFSRALGETMIVAIAAGLQPNFTLDPTQSAATITAFIVQVSLGDLPHGTIGYQSIYVAGLTLFTFTLALNLLGQYLRHRLQRYSA
jgi:phosphate transport system permease protein